MRLLDTNTFQLTEFYSDIPKYAILSHTWDKEEITFQDIENLEVAKRQTGWAKVESACAYARKYKFQWIWIDSCCINKESSAELSEAINSMYQYYLDSEVCYVYLSDVPQEGTSHDLESAFRHSKWFTRGWTLQELLAPAFAVFLTQSWTELGTKWSLRHAISSITSIPPGVLEDGHVCKYSIAQRMSWAAQRKTTRPEDQAYCLMGIFDINMPPIYGEGSYLVWTAAPEETEPRGLLARSPYEFRASGGVQFNPRRTTGTDTSFSFNNNGLQIHLPLMSEKYVTTKSNGTGPVLLAYLGCQIGSGEDRGGYIYIYLQKQPGGHYTRHLASEWLLCPEFLPEYSLQQVLVKENTFFQGPMLRRRGLRLLYPPTPRNCSYCEDLSQESPIWNLIYKVDDVKEHFAITLERNANHHQLSIITEDTQPSVFETMARAGESTSFALEWQILRQDRFQAPLRSGGLVNLAIHITSENPVLEVSCLLPGDYNIPTIPTARPTPAGFLVPTMIPRNHHALLHVCVPLDVCALLESIRKGKHLYVPITDTDIQLRSFRVLHYVPYWARGDYSTLGNIFLAFGFHKTKPWVDLVSVGIDNPQEKIPTISEIWNSYLDGGSRARARLECPVSVSSRVPWLPVDRELMVTVENLQLGTHILRLEVNDIKTERFESPTQATEGTQPKPKTSRYNPLKNRFKGASNAS
ncbi:hypothetical protein VKT23_011175 [Stygiomarasmius scandens]|uniref:Heterokaryon incompatibility domain-containing protein n=1 Tax=Marasmiellus scandens TaxID=2682957 RepID=A0ABR1JCK7_9AGAR